MNPKPNVVVLGCNFAGLTVSRYLRQEAMDAIDITVIHRNNYLNLYLTCQYESQIKNYFFELGVTLYYEKTIFC